MPPVPPPPPASATAHTPPGMAPRPPMVQMVPVRMVPVPVPHQPPPPPRLRQVTSAPPIPNPNNPVRSAPPRSVAAAAFTRAAAPTVQKLVPAQHNPALKALVPASVRIQRQKEVVPPSKRPRLLNTAQTKQSAPEEKTGKAAEDDQYLGFLDSVSGLGAFDQ